MEKESSKLINWSTHTIQSFADISIFKPCINALSKNSSWPLVGHECHLGCMGRLIFAFCKPWPICNHDNYRRIQDAEAAEGSAPVRPISSH